MLEAEGIRAAAVSGCAGVERLRFVIRGRVSHAGTTPMDARHDAGLAAAATALRVEEIAVAEGGVGTVGGIGFEPGIPTAVPGRASMLVDLRHRGADALGRMLEATREAVARLRGRARLRGVRGAGLAHRADRLRSGAGRRSPGRPARSVTGTAYELPSGALHDAASMAPHLPTAMVFSPSIGGISHAPEEDTAEPDLGAAIEAFGRWRTCASLNADTVATAS